MKTKLYSLLLLLFVSVQTFAQLDIKAKTVNVSQTLTVTGNSTLGGTTTINNLAVTGTVSSPTMSGTNTGDETATSIRSKLSISTLSGSNTGDETTLTIKTKLGAATLTLDGYLKQSDFAIFNGKQDAINGNGFVKATGNVISYDNQSYLPLTGGALSGAISATNLSGTNTGDETTATVKGLLGITTLSGSNTGDETGAGIKTKLGITTLSGSNTGDETTPTIQLKLGTASGSTDGYLTASDWNTFNSKSPAISNATATNTGLLTAANWTTFNNKQNSLSNASGTVSGILTNTDWNTFNDKQAALSGTGFVKSTAGVISYDNVNYLPLTGGTLTGAISATNLSGSNTGDETNGSLLTKIGTLPIANGGTNATTATAALTNLLPTQTGNVGKSLVTDGTNVSWGSAGGQSVETSGVVRFSADVNTNLSTITSTNTSNYGTLLTTANRVLLTGATVTGTLVVTPATGIITISKNGSYAITVTISLQSAGTTGQYGQLVKNNTTLLTPAAAYSQTSGAGMQVVLTYTGSFVAGDFIDARLNATSAGTIGVLGYSYNVVQAGSSYFTTMTPADLTTQVSGILPIANGGTNAATATAAIANLLPTQTGNTGKALITDGTVATWTTLPSNYLPLAGGTLTGSLIGTDFRTTGNVGVRTTVNANTSLDVNGSIGLGSTASTAAAYTLLATDGILYLTLNGSQTVTLPTAATSIRRIVKVSNNQNFAKTISVFTTRFNYTETLIQPNSWIELQSDGTVWREVSASDNQYEITGTPASTTIGTLGGATFTVTAWADPLSLITSTTASGYIMASVTPTALGVASDGWQTTASSGAGAELLRGASWNSVLTNKIGIYAAAYSCVIRGHLNVGARLYQIDGSTNAGNSGLVRIKILK